MTTETREDLRRLAAEATWDDLFDENVVLREQLDAATTRAEHAEQERDEYKQAYEVTLAQRDSAGRDYQAMRQERDALRQAARAVLPPPEVLEQYARMVAHRDLYAVESGVVTQWQAWLALAAAIRDVKDDESS